jgi:hypothetical protein
MFITPHKTLLLTTPAAAIDAEILFVRQSTTVKNKQITAYSTLLCAQKDCSKKRGSAAQKSIKM